MNITVQHNTITHLVLVQATRMNEIINSESFFSTLFIIIMADTIKITSFLFNGSLQSTDLHAL